MSKAKRWFWIVILVVLIWVLWMARPLFHPLVMVFYVCPGWWIFLCISLGCFIIAYRKAKKTADPGEFPVEVLWKTKIGVIASISFICFLVFISLYTCFLKRNIVTHTTYTKITKLPKATTVRILPRDVAERYAVDSLQKSREKLTESEIIPMDDKLVWTMARIPDGIVIYFTGKMEGIMTVDTETSERKTKMITQRFKISEGVAIVDNVRWQILKRRYFIRIEDIFYVKGKDEVICIVSFSRYRFAGLYQVPVFGGVFVVRSNGDIREYSPDKAMKLQFLQNTKIYPERLARLYIESYAYYLGIINRLFKHYDQIEITDISLAKGETKTSVKGPSRINRQPFFMPTKEGMKWIVATEPQGKSHGIFKVFLVDAMTGDIELYELPEEQTLTGPVRAVDYVRRQFPRIDWTNMCIVEPRPYITGGMLFWELSVVPNDFAGVVYTVFVNSATNEVLVFDNDEAIKHFVKTGKVAPAILRSEAEEKTDIESIIIEKLNQIISVANELIKIQGEKKGDND